MRPGANKQTLEEPFSTIASRYEAILASVPDIIMQVDNRKVYTWANQAGIEFFGDDVVGKDAASYFQGEQDTYKVVAPLFDGSKDTIYLESWQLRKDGISRLLGWWCRTLKDENDRVMGALSTGRDLTEIRKAEAALSESEERFRNVFENSLVGQSITSLDGGMRINKALCDMLGYSKKELLKLKWQQITHPDDVDRDQKLIDSIASGERDLARWQKRYIHKCGKTVWADVATVLQRDAVGKPLYFITTVVDITERKQAEEREAGLSRILEGSLNEIYIFSGEDFKFIEANRGARSNAGYSIEELRTMTPLDLQPEFTLQSFTELVSPLLAGEREKIEFETIHRRKDGSDYRAETHLQYLTFESKPAFVALVLDITKRKGMEEALTASEVRYRRLFEAARDGILILDADSGMVVNVNPFLVDLLGYSREQFLGKAIWEIGLFKDIAANKAHFAELQQKEFVQYEDVPLETGKGCSISVEFVSHVYDVGIQKVIQCNIRDITERIQAEKKVLRQLEELRRWQEVTLGREDRIRELKKEVDELLARLGEPIRYASQEPGVGNNRRKNGV